MLLVCPHFHFAVKGKHGGRLKGCMLGSRKWGSDGHYRKGMRQ